MNTTLTNNAASIYTVDNFKVRAFFNVIVDLTPFFTNVVTFVFNISQFFLIFRTFKIFHYNCYLYIPGFLSWLL